MKITTLVILILLIKPLIVYSQGSNLVQNGNFESFTAKPTTTGMFDLLEHWKSATKQQQGALMHSPDYIYNEIGYNRFINGTGVVFPINGKGMVGVYDYELFYQKLQSKPEDNQLYYISFNFFNSIYRNDLSTFNYPDNSIIDVFLSKDEPKYASNSNADRQFCTNGYKDIKLGSNFKKIAQIELKDYTREEWHKVAYGFTVDKSYQNLVFHVRFDNTNQTPPGCAHTYVLFDDNEIKTSCYHKCAGNFDKSIQGVSLFNGPSGVEQQLGSVEEKIRPTISHSMPVLVSIVGANYVKLIVKNSFGNEDSWEYYSVNGLSNSNYDVSNMPPSNLKNTLENYPDIFTLMWDGTINGNLYPTEEVYTIRLIIRGCFQGAYEEVFNDVLLMPSTIPNLPNYNNEEMIREDCCQAGSILIDNPSENFLRYEDNITVTGGFLLSPEMEVIHQAGNFIELQPEATFEFASNYKAEIVFCSANITKNFKIFDNKSHYESLEYRESSFIIEPNPSSGNVSIISSANEILFCRIFDQNLRELHVTTEFLNSHLVKLNLVHLSKGMYYVEIKTIYEVKYLKLILQ